MFVPLMVEGAFFIDTLEGMRPEVIAQGLDEVGPCLGTAVSVEVLKGCRESRNGKSLADGKADDAAQGTLIIIDFFEEEIIE